jgi:hypothetical protein
MVHFKSNKGKDHEDIRFEMVVDGRTSWILTDRCGGGNGTPSSSPSASSTDLTGATSSQTAYDRILVPALGVKAVINSHIRDNPEILCSFVIRPSQPFFLSDLAVLLPLVTAQATKYHPLDKQCYWYARAVYDSVKKRYPGDETIGEAYGKRGKHATYLPVPCKVTQTDLGSIQHAWTTQIAQIAQVKTITQMQDNIRTAEANALAAVEMAEANARASVEMAEANARAAEEEKRKRLEVEARLMQMMALHGMQEST